MNKKDLAIFDQRIYEIHFKRLKDMDEDITKLKTQIRFYDMELQKLRRIEGVFKYLFLYCFQRAKDISIIECSTRIKSDMCKGCMNRNEVLNKLEAKDK